MYNAKGMWLEFGKRVDNIDGFVQKMCTVVGRSHICNWWLHTSTARYTYPKFIPTLFHICMVKISAWLQMQNGFLHTMHSDYNNNKFI